jgi:hypothetical protein
MDHFCRSWFIRPNAVLYTKWITVFHYLYVYLDLIVSILVCITPLSPLLVYEITVWDLKRLLSLLHGLRTANLIDCTCHRIASAACLLFSPRDSSTRRYYHLSEFTVGFLTSFTEIKIELRVMGSTSVRSSVESHILSLRITVLLTLSVVRNSK